MWTLACAMKVGLVKIVALPFVSKTATALVNALLQIPAIAEKVSRVKSVLSRTAHSIALVTELAMLRVATVLVLLDGLAQDAMRLCATWNIVVVFMERALVPTSVDVSAHLTLLSMPQRRLIAAGTVRAVKRHPSVPISAVDTVVAKKEFVLAHLDGPLTTAPDPIVLVVVSMVAASAVATTACAFAM
jgi:hypothetical protein